MFKFSAIRILIILVFACTLSATISAAPGDVDLSFNAGTPTHPSENPSVRAIAVQTDNKILIGGIFTAVGGSARIFVARLNPDGSLDASFNAPLETLGGNSGQVLALALQPDGRILVGGAFFVGGDLANVVRLNANGSLDATFGRVVTGTSVSAIAIQPDGKIIIAGNFGGVGAVSSPGIARLDTNGSLETALGAVAGTSINVDAVALQPDGKIVIGGGFNLSGSTRQRITRLNADGTRDATFNVGDGANGDVFALAVQPNNQILVGGFFTSINGASRSAMARLNADGSIDPSFAPAFFAGSGIYSMLRQPNGKIIVVGTFGVVNGAVRVRLARLDANGALDAFYPAGTPSGVNNTIYALARQACGKFLIGGDFTAVAGIPRARLARLVDTPPRTFPDFDGDGCADLSVFRPSDGSWYVLSSSDSSFYGLQWGVSTDRLAPADYDGDGRTDIAVWREAPPAQAAFYILNSSASTFRFEQFGQTGDLPVAGDFDGDGKADAAVYRGGAQSIFFYRASLNNPSGNTTFLPWGTSADVPVGGDFDGDARADAAVFRPSNSTWFVRRSFDGSLAVNTFGLSTDKLVPADYDGDERADIAVFRGGTWYIFSSAAQTIVVSFWGTAGDTPVPADYDGDGRADVAVFRGGAWWIRQSASNSFTVRFFGLAADTPVPAAYLR